MGIELFKPSPIFTKSFTSSQQVITSAGALTLAHGMGAVPKLIFLTGVCQTGEHGYTAGEVVPISINIISNSAADNKGMTMTLDATNINIRFGSAAAVFHVSNFTTGAGADLTNANWKLVVYAVA